MASKACPPLGIGSVDMNALHDAAMKGHDLARSAEKATTRPERPKDEAEPAAKRARDSKSPGKADA